MKLNESQNIAFIIYITGDFCSYFISSNKTSIQRMHTIELIFLLLAGNVCSLEHVNHGPHVSHKNADGKHNAAYDHEAVLGNKDLSQSYSQFKA